MKKLQNSLDFLLDKYSVGQAVTFVDRRTVKIGDREVPVFPCRSERRFRELKNIVDSRIIDGISVMRVCHIAEKGTNLYDLLYTELDLCGFLLSDLFQNIMAFENDTVMNVIAVTNKGYVCTLELAATLPAGEPPIDKHEIISEHGIACDTVVDAQLKQDSVYVFADRNETYTDVDFELYGLPKDEIALIRFAFETAQNGQADALIERRAYLLRVLNAAAQSVKTGERVVL